jgi:signal transduction histidine kinase/ligand-binding sensor domain-containing protein/DNA-binding response OmpR family regulator
MNCKKRISKYQIPICLIAFIAVIYLNAQEFKASFKQLDKKDGLSQKTVNVVIQDSNGFIWIGTEEGLNRYDGIEFKVFKKNSKDTTSLSNDIIQALAEDRNGNIWIATQAGGVCKYDPRTNQFKRYIQTPKDSSLIGDNNTYSVYVQDENKIWVAHNSGLELYDDDEDRFKAIAIDNKKISAYDITSDSKDNIWIATSSGIRLLNTKTKKVEKVYKNNPANKNSLSYDKVRSVWTDNEGYLWAMLPQYYFIERINPETGFVKHYFQDEKGSPTPDNPRTRMVYQSKTGDYWLATEFKGLVRFDPETGETTPVYNQSDQIANAFNYNAYNILEDRTGSFWVGTWSKGLLHFDINANPIRYLKNISDIPNDPRTINFTNIHEDKDGFLWVSTSDKGLMRLDTKTKNIETFENIKSALNVDILRVLDITQDKKGNIWLGTRGFGLIKIDTKTNKFKVYGNLLGKFDVAGINSFHIVNETHDGTLWFATVRALAAFNPETETVEIFSAFYNNKRGLPGLLVSAIFEDMNNNLWVGFLGEGLFLLDRKTEKFTKVNYRTELNKDPDALKITNITQTEENYIWIGTNVGFFKYNIQNNSSKHYTTENGLIDNTIYDILPDDGGNIWFITNDGVSKFDPQNETFKNYLDEDGFYQSEFNIQASHNGKLSGLMYLGGVKGMNVFNPVELKNNPNIPLIKFTEFKKYTPDGSSTEINSINYTDKIILDYEEKDFSVKIAALDYTNPSKNQYAYWLEGYNDNWIETGTKRDINFTNLSPGSYTLKVKGSNNDGIWNEQGRSLDITILPPWWGTWWAYTLYALALIALLYAAYNYRINQLETIRLKELDEAKRTMYTNITHEFRTPLTVISGISKEIKEKSEGKFTEQTELIERNSKNMLYLVNQLLELRKLEIGKTKVDYIQADIMPYLKYIAESFKTYAKTKDISLHFVSITKQLVMDHDPDKLLMILSNLLSNAIKYSKPGDAVYLQVEELENDLQIRVVDSGKGIPEEKLPHIFDRFYKVQNKSDDNADGVGIGLAVTKELTELLGGTIAVESKKEQGTIFTVKLPVQNKAPLTKPAVPLLEKAVDTPQKPSTPKKVTSKKQPEDILRLLIIEDNTDIVHYLKSCLQEHWALEFASDGLKGIEKAIENVPDIILCDLMMPNANGYKVLEVLKNDATTSHIPIVILTAKADDESRIEAYKKGADAYLLKPFNKDELEIILQKLTEQRRRLQERYQTQASLRFAEGVEIHKEDTFINQLENLVLSEGSKSSYSIEKLCKDLGMSRTQLHNKIKALTGKSTSIFVRSLRLQKGKFLLENTSKTISEIAYDVGFNNPSYFTKSFTEEFGIPPSSLRK